MSLIFQARVFTECCKGFMWFGIFLYRHGLEARLEVAYFLNFPRVVLALVLTT